MQRYLFSALLLVLTGWSSLPARADFYAHPWKDRHDSGSNPDSGLELSYLNTNSNYDSGGNQGVPVGFQNMSRFIGDLDLLYPVNPDFTLFGRLDWMAERLNSVTTTGTGLTAGTSTGVSNGGNGYGLGDQTVGASYRLLDSRKGDPALPGAARTTIDLQAQCDFPGYSNTTSAANSTPPLGDGSVDSTGGIFIAVPLYTFSTGANLFLTGGTGYTYRSAGYSAAIPFTGGFLLTRSDTATDRGLGVYASVVATGFYSLATDSNSISAGATGAGGSTLVDAVNPSFLAGRGEIGFQTQSRLALYGYFTQSVWGKNAPVTTLIGGGLRLSLGGPPAGETSVPQHEEKPVSPVRQTDHAYGKGNQGFVSYNLETRVSRINDRLNLLKIDRGQQDSVEVGQQFDIFSVRPNGQIGDAIARAKVTSVKNNEAALTITEYFREVLINEGFIAKRLVQ